MKYILLFLLSTTAMAGVSIQSEPFLTSYGYTFRGTGVSGTMTKNATTNLDYKAPYTLKITGIHMMLKDQCWGDTMELQVVDVDNILGYGANFVLAQYGKDWNVISDTESQGRENMPYAAEISVNLYLRIVYTSTCNVNDVGIKINYFLHEMP